MPRFMDFHADLKLPPEAIAQIASIAAAAAIVAAIAAVLVGRTRTARRRPVRPLADQFL